MKRILFCVLMALAMVACGNGKTGALGGLSSVQAGQLSDFQSSWADARTAYQSVISVAPNLPPGRAKLMTDALRSSQCVPALSGFPNQPFDRNWSYQRSLNGGSCPVSAGDTQSFTKANGSATYALGYSYSVAPGTHGQDFQRLNPLHSFILSGELNVYGRGSSASTNGRFRLDAYQGVSHIPGAIEISNGQLQIEIDFPNIRVTGSAQWGTWGSSGTKYTIQGESVSESTFDSAFKGFAVSDLINKAQEIPNSL